VLYAEGKEPEGVFILCNGRAKISVESKRGSVVILKVAEAGEALGLEAVQWNRPYEETAELLEVPSQVCPDWRGVALPSQA
jgi:CRP/FNR family transcriptional regulator